MELLDQISFYFTLSLISLFWYNLAKLELKFNCFEYFMRYLEASENEQNLYLILIYSIWFDISRNKFIWMEFVNDRINSIWAWIVSFVLEIGIFLTIFIELLEFKFKYIKLKLFIINNNI